MRTKEKRYFGEQDYFFELEVHSLPMLQTLDVRET
jgi:hypothetical protein